MGDLLVPHPADEYHFRTGHQGIEQAHRIARLPEIDVQKKRNIVQAQGNNIMTNQMITYGSSCRQVARMVSCDSQQAMGRSLDPGLQPVLDTVDAVHLCPSATV